MAVADIGVPPLIVQDSSGDRTPAKRKVRQSSLRFARISMTKLQNYQDHPSGARTAAMRLFAGSYGEDWAGLLALGSSRHSICVPNSSRRRGDPDGARQVGRFQGPASPEPVKVGLGRSHLIASPSIVTDLAQTSCCQAVIDRSIRLLSQDVGRVPRWLAPPPGCAERHWPPKCPSSFSMCPEGVYCSIAFGPLGSARSLPRSTSGLRLRSDAGRGGDSGTAGRQIRR
jgi:hypothetical protein